MIHAIKQLPHLLKEIAAAISSLAATVHDAATAPTIDPSIEGRVGALERELTRVVAECEALVMSAETKYKAARSAEERERRIAQSRNGSGEIDQEDIDLEAARAIFGGDILGVDAGASPHEGVPPVHQGLVGRASGKAAARAAKWSR